MSKINFYFNGKNYSIAKSALASAFTSLTSAFEALTAITGLEFTSNGDGTCYVSGIGDCTDTDIIIPATSPAGDSVTSIGYGAFEGCNGLTSIVIPEGVTSVGEWAFSCCYNLSSVVIPDSVIFIGDYAFRSCENLSFVVIPDSVTSIGAGVFGWCYSLNNIEFTGTIEQWSAITKSEDWNYDSPATYVQCSDGQVDMNGNVIGGDSGDSGSENGSEGLAFISNNDGTCYISGLGGCTDTDIIIPTTSFEGDRVTSIGEYAFGNCDHITSVVIPNSVTSIGSKAFYGCSNLSSIVIPNSIVDIGNQAFIGCTSLNSVVIPDSVTSIGDYAFLSCWNLNYIEFTGTIEQWNAIAKGAEWCTDMPATSIQCSDGQVNIGGNDIPDDEELLEGDGAEFYTLAPTELSFRSTAPLNEFNEVQVNGETVDPSNYTLEEGSTIVKFPIDYLKTFDVGNYEVNVVSESKTVKGGFRVKAPNLNNYGFYYNQPYTAYVEAFGGTTVFFIREGEILDIKVLETNYTENTTYTNDGNSLIINSSQGNLTINATAEGIYCEEFATTFVIGDVAAVADEYFIYTYKEDFGGYEVTVIDKAKTGHATIKTGINGIDTTSIGNYALRDCDCITGITIPKSVINIGSFPFTGCTNLANINVEEGNEHYQSIDGNLYSKDGKTLIQYAIGKSNTSFIIPDTVTSISRSAFEDCNNLSSIKIPDNVTSIGNVAFGWCNGLNSVEIGNGLTSISMSAFVGCSNLKSVIIGNNVEDIDDDAFRECGSLNSIVIPEGVTRIGSAAFSECNSLTSVVIPSSVTSIESSFFGCLSLTSITVDPGNEYYQSINDNLYTKDGSTLLQYAAGKTDTEFTIPSGVSTVDCYAFQNSTNLRSVIIPNSVTRINESTFNGCTNLTSIEIPDSVTSIGGYAFADCTSLDSVIIPNSVTWISWSLFKNCTSLTSMVIPDSMTSIEEYAFSGCTSLTSVVIPDSMTSIGNYVFSGCTNLNNIEFTGTTEQWDTINKGYDWNSGLSAGYVQCSDGQVDISEVIVRPSIGLDFVHNGDGTCYVSGIGRCTDTDLIIPSNSYGNSVTAIGDYAFSSCINLTSAVIPDTVNSIGTGAFQWDENLTSVVIPDTVTSIGNDVFWGCTSLTNIEFKGTVEQWNAIAKGNKWNITVPTTYVQCSDGQAEIPSNSGSGDSGNEDLGSVGLEFISNGDGTCFVNGIGDCTDTNIIIPKVSPEGDSVTGIGNVAFSGCSSLESIVIPDSVTWIGETAFYSCTSLVSIVIPDSVTSIGEWAFNSCSGLTDIVFGNNVASIGDLAFRGCAVSSVVIPNSVINIGLSAFNWCENLSSVVIGDSVTDIGSFAFANCNNLNNIEFTGTVEQWKAITKNENWNYNSPATYVQCSDGQVDMNGNVIGGEDSGEGDSGNEDFGSGSVGLAFTSNGDGTCYVSGLGDCTDTDVVIPTTSPDGDIVTSIGYGAFQNCTSLTSVTFAEGSQLTSIGGRAFSDCTSLASIEIPVSVTSIGNMAFWGCTSLTSIEIPASVTSIGDGAFQNCTSLTSVTFAEGSQLTSIGSPAFSNCTSLTSVVIPDSVTSIGDYAFSSCSNLTSVVIGDSVTSIGIYAFGWCNSLNSIEFKGTVTQWSATTLGEEWNYDAPVTYIQCSDGQIDMDGNITGGDSGEDDSGNEDFGSESVGLAFTSNGDGTCSVKKGSCTDTDVVIPATSPDGDSVTSIGDQAFRDYSSLVSVTIPDSVTSIGSCAFYDCSNLRNIEFKGTTSQWNAIIKGESWYDYVPVDYITCSDKFVDLNGNVFEDGLKFISNGDGTCYVDGIGTYTDTDLIIPETSPDGDNVTAIGAWAFNWKDSLTSAVIPDSVTCIDVAAFRCCSSLSYVKIGNGVTSINDQVFENCTNLNTIEFTGTTAQWNAITKGELWNDGIPATYVQCSDGQVSLV